MKEMFLKSAILAAGVMLLASCGENEVINDLGNQNQGATETAMQDTARVRLVNFLPQPWTLRTFLGQMRAHLAHGQHTHCQRQGLDRHLYSRLRQDDGQAAPGAAPDEHGGRLRRA